MRGQKGAGMRRTELGQSRAGRSTTGGGTVGSIALRGKNEGEIGLGKKCFLGGRRRNRDQGGKLRKWKLP